MIAGKFYIFTKICNLFQLDKIKSRCFIFEMEKFEILVLVLLCLVLEMKLILAGLFDIYLHFSFTAILRMCY